MHKNEDIFVKQAQEFSPRLFYFALWHGGQTSDKGEKIPLFLIVLLFEKIYKELLKCKGSIKDYARRKVYINAI